MTAVANDLEVGFQILWYQIQSVLGRGGFGITYLAEDTNLGKLVAIKEYLPHDFASRSSDSTVQPISIEHDDVYAWGLERFMSEAQTLAKFHHDNIVQVFSVFKHNNTGYMVMRYEQGRDLKKIYEEKQQLSQSELEHIYFPIMDGLKAVHAEGFIHRDIKPANIYIRDNGSPVLLDFGAARLAIGGKTKTLTAMLSVGYAPFEQYNDDSGKQGPWTDIYALGANLYQGVTGEKPMESTLRGMASVHNDPDPYNPLSFSAPGEYSPEFLRAIDESLKMQIHERPQSLEEFIAMLRGDKALPRLSADRFEPTTTRNNTKTVVRPRNNNQAPLHLVDKPASHDSESVAPDPGNKSPEFALQTKTPNGGLFTKRGIKKSIAIVIVIGVLGAIGFVLFPLELSPEEKRQLQIDLLLKKADGHFVAGKYFDVNGDSALGVYGEVIALDPENRVAIEARRKISIFYLRDADDLIESMGFDAAKEKLKIVQAINPEFPGLKELESKLSSSIEQGKRSKRIAIYLNGARRALEENHAYDPQAKSAYMYFNKALELAPDNAEAVNGLNAVAQRIVLDAQKALKANDRLKAKNLAALAEGINPDTPGINEIRQQLTSASRLEKIIARADAAHARQRFTTPKAENAADLYKEVLKISPGNSHATRMLRRIAAYYAQLIEGEIRQQKFKSAQTNLNVLTSRFPDFTDNKSLEKALSSALQREKVLKSIEHLLPVGISQEQSDDQVIQDIVGEFVTSFRRKNMSRLKEVAQMNPQTEDIYMQLFGLYTELDINIIDFPAQKLSVKNAKVIKLQISGLVDKRGNDVESNASWTKIQLSINKKNGYWFKADWESW